MKRPLPRAASLGLAFVLLLGLSEPGSPRHGASESASSGAPASLNLQAPKRQGPAAGREAGRAPQGKPNKREREASDQGATPPEPPEPDMAEADRFFGIADYNRDGWISFREASASLELDQVRFSAYDKDPRDGRITPDEFRAVYAETVRSLGAFRPPRPDPETGGAEIEEAAPLEAEPIEPTAPPTSVTDLFGRAEPRRDDEELIPRPPRIAGPIPVFRRLDLDADGLISGGDLEELLRPLQVRVRINAVLASLDADGSGAVDREEFSASMRGAAPTSAR